MSRIQAFGFAFSLFLMALGLIDPIVANATGGL